MTSSVAVSEAAIRVKSM